MKTVNVQFSENAVNDLANSLGITHNILIDICRVLNEDINSDFQPVDDEEIIEYEYDDANGDCIESIMWSVGSIRPNHMGSYTVQLFA